jgi:hypothetical protein
MLHAYAELMRNKWVILIADTKYADEMKRLDKIVEYDKNRFALSKGIINILRRAGWDAGFYGNVKISGKNPYEIKRT